jgi:hypothetical protein
LCRPELGHPSIESLGYLARAGIPGEARAVRSRRCRKPRSERGILRQFDEAGHERVEPVWLAEEGVMAMCKQFTHIRRGTGEDRTPGCHVEKQFQGQYGRTKLCQRFPRRRDQQHIGSKNILPECLRRLPRYDPAPFDG